MAKQPESAVPTQHVPTEGLISPERVPVRRALISVYDKTGLTDLAAALVEAGVEILSTGSTAATIAGAGLPVARVEDVTGFPECLEGRVKSLHPAIHAGILADRRKTAHMSRLAELDIAPIDLVVVNLYPFSDTVASGAPFDACIEQIDIGGPAMVRAAAKNHSGVAVVVEPSAYDEAAAAVRAGWRPGGPGVINSSRAILYASSGANFADAARAAALATRAQLQAALPAGAVL